MFMLAMTLEGRLDNMRGTISRSTIDGGAFQ